MHTRPDVWYRRLTDTAESILGPLRHMLADTTDRVSLLSAVLRGARPVDAFLTARVLGGSALDLRESPQSRPGNAPGTGLDLTFWRALHLRETPPIDLLCGTAGPLIPPEGSSIELWTETELCALHAAWWFGRTSQPWRERVLEAARWHVENTQPDNATGSPWAIHLMIDLACADDSAEAELFAQTLLHNCVVATGRPDTRSALILHDAAVAVATLEPNSD